MSFDDLVSDNERGRICDRADECDKEFCLHKHPHDVWELGRPEQDPDGDYEDNWDCSEAPCKHGGRCLKEVPYV